MNPFHKCHQGKIAGMQEDTVNKLDEVFQKAIQKRNWR